ncbi:MAG: hypothetical protein MUO89_01940, partial [Dehalococcoidia bacterium]|nr:hypothetical protein [Dehalococcoidia bacterium]
IWVHDANRSTIKNCTIIGGNGRGGNKACIFIGGRIAGVAKLIGTPIWDYNVAEGTKGHTIQNNTFRYLNAGNGWGIFAVKLTDDSLIKGNTFNGDAADLAAWNVSTNEGAPGTCIQIHSATNGSGTYAVVIEDNTAQYVKYSLVTFTASYPYNDSDGYMYEQQEVSTVEDVNVKNNTVHNLGENALHKNGAAITFQGQKRYDAYAPGTADLTIGAGGVIIRNNALYDNGIGVNIKAPNYSDPAHDPAGDGTYGCVLSADNITCGPNNRIFGNYNYNGINLGYGLYNGTIEANQTGGAKTITAEYNWWGFYGPRNTATNPTGLGNQVSNSVDYSPYWANSVMTYHIP